MSTKYASHVNAFVASATRTEIERIKDLPAATEEGLGLSDVIREALDVGLPLVRARLTERGGRAPRVSRMPARRG